MSLRTLQTRIAALSFAVIAAAGAPVQAQSRFALELDLGFDQPLSPSVHDAVLLSDAESGETSASAGTPILVNRLNRPGFHVGVSALISTLEVRYRFERFAWRGARALCEGDREAARLPNGEVEDAEVVYSCTRPGERISVPGDEEGALTFHHVSVGPRFYLRRPQRSVVRDGVLVERDRTRLYGILNGGVTLAGYEDPNLGRRLKPGLNAGAGGGAEFQVDRRISIAFDVRYTLSMVAGSSSPTVRAGRAAANDRNVVSALFDVYHRVGANLGFRFDFR
jgi:hypothetical protein